MASATFKYIILQTKLEASLQKDLEDFENLDKGTITETYCRSLIIELEDEFACSRDRHDKIVTSKVTESADKYVDENIFDRIRSTYHKYWAVLNSHLPKTSRTDEIPFNSTIVQPQCKQFELQLPKMHLPTFDGSYDNWMAFNNLFVAMVHNNTSLEPIQKLQYLKSSLTGDALNIVKNLELTNENYSTARSLLINRFQHTRRLVNTYLKKLFDYPKIMNENSKSIKGLVDNINECSASLQQLNVEVLNYPLIFHLIRKLPLTTATAWEESLGADSKLPEFTDFIHFLENKYRTLEMLEPLDSNTKKTAKVFHSNSSKDNKQSQNNSSVESKQFSRNSRDSKSKKFEKSKSFSTNTKTNSNTKSTACGFCNGEHYITRCDRFSKLSQRDRLDYIKNNRCCTNCLSSTHEISNCSSKRLCRVCNQKHNTLLHSYNNSNTGDSLSSTCENNFTDRPTTKLFHTQTSQTQNGTLFGTAQVRALNEYGTSLVVRVLVDPCSEDNFILSSTVNSLNLQKYFEPSHIEVVGNNSSTDCSYRVNLMLRSMDNRFHMKISAGVVDTLTSELPSVPMPKDVFGFITKLPIADPAFNKPGSIQILLGIGFYTRIRLEEIKRYGDDLIAENTLLGYIIRGTAPTQSSHRSKKVFMTQSTAVELNKNIQKFWEVEELDRKRPLNPDDEECERIFKSTIRRESDGRLSMDLPFKDNVDPFIGPSRFMAEKRFFSLERKLKNNKALREEYFKTIQNYLDSNHLVKVPKTKSSLTEYFLPHHAVCKESSTTTKVRVVFDASCKSLDGTSLNDHLLTGPKLQTDIRDVLFNWRQYPISLTADIEKMYRMFNINKRHHNYQKIVWRFSEDQPTEDYALTTATFGTSCAPFLAIRCLHFIAEQCESTHSLASSAIRQEFYVDDFISGAFSVNEAITKQTQVRQVLDSYHLSLRKWSSNDASVISNIPHELLDVSKEISFDETDYRKTLGIYWSQAKDSFFFSINSTEDPQSNFTKRQVLSLIARLYDPLGWASPCTMFAKQLMQRIWQTKAGWDDPIEESIRLPFQTFLQELPSLRNFQIPRWTQINDSTSPLTILGFCDASDKGYGAVIYLVDPKPSDKRESLILLTSKTRVADLKYESTARLELNGAVLLSELLKWTVELYKPRETNVVAFSDSKIVLAWLQSHPSRWKTYIANRTSQILDWMKPTQWSYVNTKVNPADIASRGLLPNEFMENTLWLNGPKLSDLKIEKSTTLSEEQTKIFEDAIKKNSLILHINSKKSSPFVQDFSDHGKMQRFIESLTRFVKPICQKLVSRYEAQILILKDRINRLSIPKDRHLLFITKILQRILNKNIERLEQFSKLKSNLLSSENIIFRLAQNETYHEEISNLKQGKQFSKQSKLKGLHPFIDKNGILRVGGRLQNSDLTYFQKHPIILPSKHQVTTNIIRQAHFMTLHGSERLTSAYLKNKYHIPRMSEKVRNLIHACNTCFRFSKQNQEQLMGSLPKNRVQFSRSFEHTGVDYAGPIVTKCYPGRCKKYQKSYIALFVCLCTKALHLEVVSELSSQAFLAAFRRFVGRRGRCHKLYSNNGTNFVGAEKILNNEIRKAELTWKTDLDIDFQSFGTDWHFNPPSSPHFGGLWEAGVKSVKSHLKKTVGSSLLTFEELTTILVQIEGVLNSRPLCPMTNNPNEFNFLTPAHFLIGRSIVAPIEESHELTETTPTNRWNHLQISFQRFVRLWRKDYLQNLQNRPKGQKINCKMKVGDLVLITEDDVPPTIWPTAIITDIHPGKDDIVRVATVRTSSGKLYKRPVVKLRLLPCNTPFENV